MSNRRYKMVRLRTQTHARLAALRDRLFAAYQDGYLTLPDSQVERLSLDFVIDRLIGHHDAHARRRATSRRKNSNDKMHVYTPGSEMNQKAAADVCPSREESPRHMAELESGTTVFKGIVPVQQCNRAKDLNNANDLHVNNI
jgi:hypothetical protein